MPHARKWSAPKTPETSNNCAQFTWMLWKPCGIPAVPSACDFCETLHSSDTAFTNTRHWTEQVSWNYTKTNHCPMTQGIPASGGLCTSLCWKKVFMMYSALLQHSCRRTSPFTSALPRWPIAPFHTTTSFRKGALKSFTNILDLLVLTLRRASPISSTNSWYYALEPCAYIKHRERSGNFNMHTLPSMESTHQHSPPAEDIQAYPLQPGYTLLAQRRSRRVSTHRPTAQQC